MLNEPEREKRSVFRNPLLYTSAALLAALVYTGLVFYSRWQQEQEYEQRAAEKEAQQREADERAVELMGGNRFEIMAFFVSPKEIRSGESATMCYRVSNAKEVRLDPPDVAVWPALNRCVEMTPRKTTTYTLTIEDAEKHTQSAQITVTVH